MQTNKRGFRSFPVILRECSVVIIGSTCRICGRDFKCESDVALHTRWRHNASFMDILDQQNLDNISEKCDVCNMPFEFFSDLKTHKRLIHKHKMLKHHRGKTRKIRVRFKLNGVTTTDVNLDRRYIKLQNSVEYLVNVCTQSADSFKNEVSKRKDDYTGNIDLSFPNHVVNKSHMQHGIQSGKTTNRYIVNKFASTEGDASRHTVLGGRSFEEISNAPHKNEMVDINSYHKYTDSNYLATQSTTDKFIRNNNTHIRDKENSRKIEQKRKNIHIQNKIFFDDKILLAYQAEKSDMPLTSKENNSCESPHYSIRWPDEVTEIKETAELANSFIHSMEKIINNKKSYNFENDATKDLSPVYNEKSESMKTNTNVDDDVQEVLRIIRGNAQNDINHESPNRVEREMLVQNTISNVFVLPSQDLTVGTRNDIASTNFKSSNYPEQIAKSDYQILTNTLNKKLGIYLNNLHYYGNRIYNDLLENNLEEYALYIPQNFVDMWRQSNESPYNSLKVTDNDVAVILD